MSSAPAFRRAARECVVRAVAHALLVAPTLVHRTGEMTDCASEQDLDDLIARVGWPSCPDHPAVAITVESGWTLSAFATGLVVFENVEDHARFVTGRDSRATSPVGSDQGVGPMPLARSRGHLRALIQG